MAQPVPTEEVEMVLKGSSTDSQGNIVEAEITVKVLVPQPQAQPK